MKTSPRLVFHQSRSKPLSSLNSGSEFQPRLEFLGAALSYIYGCDVIVSDCITGSAALMATMMVEYCEYSLD